MTYVPDILNTIPKWQKYALSASILSVICMFVYACYLYRKITRRKIIWYPRGRKGYSTSYPGMEPTSINGRLHSGIIQGRSHSSGNFEMQDGGIISQKFPRSTQKYYWKCMIQNNVNEILFESKLLLSSLLLLLFLFLRGETTMISVKFQIPPVILEIVIIFLSNDDF